MGYCPNCGRPCTACSREATDFSLLALPEESRKLVTVVLKKMLMNNESDQSILVQKLLPYKDKSKYINNGLREYIAMRNPPRSIAYVAAIVKGKVTKINDRLDALPPLAEGYEDERDEGNKS
jgi:hypothetical protein